MHVAIGHTEISWRFSIGYVVVHVGDTEGFDGRSAHANTQKAEEENSQHDCSCPRNGLLFATSCRIQTDWC